MGDRTPSPTRRTNHSKFNPNNRHENLRKRKGEERAARDPELMATKMLVGFGPNGHWYGAEFGIVPPPSKTPERRPTTKSNGPSKKHKTVSRVYKPKRGGGRRVTRRKH